ncbi:hypothetical protein Tco_1212293 [Tanacetum coccineum]
MEGNVDLLLGEVRKLGLPIRQGRRNQHEKPPQLHLAKLSGIAQECSVHSEPRPTILLRNISTFTKQSDVLRCFNIKGKKIVKEVEILHSKERMNTKCCLLYLYEQNSVQEILAKSCQRVDDAKVTTEPFKGFENHPDLYEKGRYEMLVSGFPIFKDDEGESTHRNLEKFFERFPTTGIDFYRDATNQFSGSAKIYFKTEESRSIAAAKVKGERKKWSVEIIPLDTYLPS